MTLNEACIRIARETGDTEEEIAERFKFANLQVDVNIGNTIIPPELEADFLEELKGFALEMKNNPTLRQAVFESTVRRVKETNMHKGN